MYVNAILNLAVQRLRSLFPEWLNLANCYVTPLAVDEGTAVGRHWLNVFYAGSSFEQADAGNLARRWRLGLAYYHMLSTDQQPRYTMDALTIQERMRLITGTLDLDVGPSGLHLWMPYAVDTLSFTSRARTITTITKANPGKVTTSAAHNFATGQAVRITSVSGMTEVNNRIFNITVVDTTSFTIDCDTSGYTSAGSGGTARRSGQAIIPDRTIRRHGTSVTGQVADVQVTSGTWTNGDAAGIIYLGNVAGIWTAGQVDADAYGSSAAAVLEVCQSAGATTQTQLVAQPLRIVSERSPRELPANPSCLSVQQDYEVLTIA